MIQTEASWNTKERFRRASVILCSQRTTQWGWRVRGRPQHGDISANNSGVLREAGHLGCVCNKAGGLTPFAYIPVLGISGPVLVRNAARQDIRLGGIMLFRDSQSGNQAAQGSYRHWAKL